MKHDNMTEEYQYVQLLCQTTGLSYYRRNSICVEKLSG